MPVEYRYNISTKRLFTRFWGKVTDGDVRKQALAAAQDPDIESGIRELVDLTEVEEVEVSSDSLRFVVNTDLEYQDKYKVMWTAIVAPTDFLYGMSRMFETMATVSGSPAKVRSFRDRVSAEQWLDQPEADR